MENVRLLLAVAALRVQLLEGHNPVETAAEDRVGDAPTLLMPLCNLLLQPFPVQVPSIAREMTLSSYSQLRRHREIDQRQTPGFGVPGTPDLRHLDDLDVAALGLYLSDDEWVRPIVQPSNWETGRTPLSSSAPSIR